MLTKQYKIGKYIKAGPEHMDEWLNQTPVTLSVNRGVLAHEPAFRATQ